MKSRVLYLYLSLVALAVPASNALAEGEAPFEVDYKCSTEIEGSLEFSSCFLSGPLFEAYQCNFSASFPSATYPSGEGEVTLSATFLVESPSPVPHRKVCLASAAGGYGGDINGPLPYVFSSAFAGFGNSVPKSLRSCAAWIKAEKPFRVNVTTYSQSAPGIDSLVCDLVIKNL